MKPNNQLMSFKNVFRGLAYSVCIAAFAASVTSCKKDDAAPAPVADIVSFKDVSVSSAQETPTTSSTASGVLNVDYDKNSKSLKYTITYSGLTPTSMHFHKGAIGAAGGVEREVPGPYTSGMTGTVTLTAAQEADLLANNWYLNVHTAANAGGEIRGQVVPNTMVVFANISLSGKQEVPRNTSATTGVFNGLYDKTTKKVTYSISVTGATPTAMHLHNAKVGTNGDVVVELTGTGGTTTALTATQETDLLAGNFYFNAHTSAFPGGEIRGQVVGDNMIVFSNSLSGSNEIPSNVSIASGTVYGLYDKSTKSLKYVIAYSGLTPTAMHFHKAAAGANGDVVFEIPAPYSSGMSGSVTLTAAQETDLLSKLWYVNVHSAAFAGGELRTQLVK